MMKLLEWVILFLADAQQYTDFSYILYTMYFPAYLDLVADWDVVLYQQVSLQSRQQKTSGQPASQKGPSTSWVRPPVT